jgi:hypothetical protein
MKQFLITVAAGKRLIAKALAKHPEVLGAARKGTLVIVAGTTNGYVAEEVLKTLGADVGFSRKRFFRGITLPPNQGVTAEGRLSDESGFPGDVVISRGVWQKGKTLADVVDSLKEGDAILKGANAVDLAHKQAAILISNSKAGTAGLLLPAVVGRRVRLIIPVGLEKRVDADLMALAQKLNSPGASSHRLIPVPGEVFTELDALAYLSGACVELISAGGVCGAEGACWVAVTGTKQQEAAAERIFSSLASEPPFTLNAA